MLKNLLKLLKPVIRDEIKPMSSEEMINSSSFDPDALFV